MSDWPRVELTAEVFMSTGRDPARAGGVVATTIVRSREGSLEPLSQEHETLVETYLYPKHVRSIVSWRRGEPVKTAEAPADTPAGPTTRGAGRAAVELLASMEADHARIAPAAEAVATAARQYTTTSGDPQRNALVEALDALIEVLIPHLDREVAEAMPVVAASITNREWDAVEQEYNIKPKSTRELALEGHWLLEGIDTEGYAVVVHKVPAVLRFILLHGFGRGYRRQARARWMPDDSRRGAVMS